MIGVHVADSPSPLIAASAAAPPLNPLYSPDLCTRGRLDHDGGSVRNYDQQVGPLIADKGARSPFHCTFETEDGEYPVGQSVSLSVYLSLGGCQTLLRHLTPITIDQSLALSHA